MHLKFFFWQGRGLCWYLEFLQSVSPKAVKDSNEQVDV